MKVPNFAHPMLKFAYRVYSIRAYLGRGPCMGNHMGVPAPKEVTISSGNRNFRGRMGTADSEVYISNPAVVAASAVMGYIADPRDL